jgi:hypothetical protein
MEFHSFICLHFGTLKWEKQFTGTITFILYMLKKELVGIQLQIKNLHAYNCYFETASAVQLVSPVDGRHSWAASSTE